MYLHIGHDTMIDTGRIVAILNKNLMDHSPEVRQMVHRLNSIGALQGDLADAKTMILTDSGLVMSSISAATLYKRAGKIASEGSLAMWYTEI
ncbi:MAG: DUF370 domain-containing protein [Sulfobacillus thermosulfidooxidans]|uniref:DUF370 domain-containing protein n=1 Tax=Sulfobacillus thermotolerans TaxID=338644 RepID=A0ABM6RMP2_9FIRM|nr:extracellular matrix/biofilm biosynthesis regulator RemA family protein [Sulfobacillus sp. hq2]AUW92571.1 hypothetical protein BXT84_00230 [Sulfobacillus thermotolerans]POB12061.1 hypothetical protein CO251_01190 [Sulfobacillus sp. hq2]PSR35622.1 MAG: DUF370 domain-containing protein [Sulfobacillus thermosulfidooxidans]